MPNPVGLPFLEGLEEPFFNVWPIGIMVIVVGSAASLFVRNRHAGQEVRQQIKGLLVAVGITVAFFVPGKPRPMRGSQGSSSTPASTLPGGIR